MIKKPIKIELTLNGGIGSVIPKGEMEKLTIEIVDEMASFHFLNPYTAQKFALTQQAEGVQSVFSERLQKVICRYPNVMQEELVKNIEYNLARLKNG